jgi:pyrroline-5-carboxylate reductase
LEAYAKPARPYRVLPISCVAINQSPILIYPENEEIRSLFCLLGNVHLLADEKVFEPATSLVGAFYAWLFALMEEAVTWNISQDLEPDLARDLVVETMQGACAMAQAQREISLSQIWESLATPGGISEHGIKIINQRDCLKAWSEALQSVTDLLRR